MKLLFFPVSKDFPSERAFWLFIFALRFQFAFLDLDLDFDVRFLGTAIDLFFIIL